MTDKKLTYKEIIKALECCLMERQCNYCPLYKEHSVDCLDTVLKNAYALITRQQAEIESLKIFREYAEKRASDYRTMRDKYLNAKSGAIKEFAKRLKNKIKTECNPYGKPTFDYDTSISIMRYIDNLVQEMVDDIIERVSFKVENGASEKIAQDAYKHGMNKSEYLRWLIDEQRKEDEGK